MKLKKRKRYLEDFEKQRLKKYVFFFLIIILLAVLSFFILSYFSNKSIINEKTQMIIGFSSFALLMVGLFPAELIGKRIEDNRYYDQILGHPFISTTKFKFIIIYLLTR